jgi:hypothetical protein
MQNESALRGVAYGPLFFGLLTWVFACSEIYQRAALQLDGRVVASATGCQQPANNRCATTYVVEAQDGSRATYVAGPTDHSLQRWLAVGTIMRKDRWRLFYAIDGRKVDDFPVIFYATILVFGSGCALWASKRLRSR